MTITLNLSADVEERLRRAAEARGQDIGSYLLSLVEEDTFSPSSDGEIRSREDAIRVMREVANKAAVVQPQLLTRSSYYEDESNAA